MNQHETRKLALQAIFLFDQNTEMTADEAMRHVKESLAVDDKKIDDYFSFLVRGVITNVAELDQKISRHLQKNWQLKRVSAINRAILQLAIFEIENSDRIPNAGAVNEALNLTAEFGDETSKAFINGVLSNFMNGDRA